MLGKHCSAQPTPLSKGFLNTPCRLGKGELATRPILSAGVLHLPCSAQSTILVHPVLIFRCLTFGIAPAGREFSIRWLTDHSGSGITPAGIRDLAQPHQLHRQPGSQDMQTTTGKNSLHSPLTTALRVTHWCGGISVAGGSLNSRLRSNCGEMSFSFLSVLSALGDTQFAVSTNCSLTGLKWASICV